MGALGSNAGGIANTAFGIRSLQLSSGTLANTAYGSQSLWNNTSGNENTAVGSSALGTNTTGSRNTAIGWGADVSGSDYTNAMAIGSTAIVSASNTVQIGNVSVGHVWFGSGSATLHANTTISSDSRFKYNIQDNVPGLEFITKLKPVTYYFDEEKLKEFRSTGIMNSSIIRSASFAEGKVHTGFLAQDVEVIVKELGYSFDGVHAPENDKDHYSLAYTKFIMPLVKAVQEQQEIIVSQAKQMLQMNEKIEKLVKVVELMSGK